MGAFHDITTTLPYTTTEVNSPRPPVINRKTRRHEKALLRRAEKQRG